MAAARPYQWMPVVIMMLVSLGAAAPSSPSAINVDVFRDVKYSSGRRGGLAINCSIDAKAAELETVAAITLLGSSPYGTGDEFEKLASMDIWSKQPKLADKLEGADVLVDGDILSEPPLHQFLSLTWQSPSVGPHHSYKCVANGIDKGGEATSQSTVVTEQPPDVGCCHKMDVLQEEVSDLSSKVFEIESDLKAFEQNMLIQFRIMGIDKTQFDVSPIYYNRVYLVHKKAQAFNIAANNDDCRQCGGYLVEFDDTQEYQFVYDFVKRIGGANSFWTGGNDIENDRTYVYFNSGKPVPQLPWASGQPDHLPNEDCMEIRLNFGALNDWRCNQVGKYVCEIPLVDEAS